MVNGRIARSMPAARARRGPRAAAAPARRALERPTTRKRTRRRGGAATSSRAQTQVFTVRARHGEGAPLARRPGAERAVRGFTRWNAGGTRRDRWSTSRDRATVAGTPPPPDAGRDRAQGLRVPRRRQQRPRRLRRRHLRHQGPRAVLPAQLPREARPARGDGRPRRPRASRRRRACIRAKSRAIIRRASARCSPATAAARSPRWRSPSSISSRAGATSAA